MKSSDILSMALRNLRGRRSRTRLTVIGVIVGTCAIVIMISVGVGINETLTRQYRNSASATRISVYVDTAASEASGEDAPPLDDSAVEFLSGISGVRTVLPVIDMTERVQITRGRYAYTGGSVTALELDRLGELGVTVSGGSSGGTALFGSSAAVNFTDNNGNAVKSETDDSGNIISCEIDPLKDSFSVAPVQEGASGGSQHSRALRVGGVMTSPGSTGMDTSNSVFMDISAARELLREYNALNSKPNTPQQYSEIYVWADDVESVSQVQQAIASVGLATYSNEDEIAGTKRTMAAVQLVLGAVGAVSMLVAAFGISNTMVMAVYERKKEIGVMKVLGCDTADIKAVFLCEAGMIGLLGGGIGVLISLLVSAAANLAAGALIGSLGGDASAGMTVSSVPWWLALLGIGFAVLVGVISGVSPANRAVKVSALKAIHNE